MYNDTAIFADQLKPTDQLRHNDQLQERWQTG
jgi:hypothetical protein